MHASGEKRANKTESENIPVLTVHSFGVPVFIAVITAQNITEVLTLLEI